MACKLYTKLSEDGKWIAVIDMKKSVTKKYPRIFMSESEAQHFIKTNLADVDQNWIKIEEITDEI
jgi:hypothetical protein